MKAKSYLHFISLLCYENFATALVDNLRAGNHLFENVLMDLKVSQNGKELSLSSLQQQNKYKIKPLTINETRKIKDNNIQEINGYLEYLIDKRYTELLCCIQNYETYLEKTYPDAASIADGYSFYLKRYFNKTFNIEDAINDIDKEFVMFDLMETSNKLLFNTKRKIISNMTDNRNVSNNVNAVLTSQYYQLIDDLHKENIDNKKEEMKNICEMFDICRVFPSYSDHISDLINEILLFSDTRLDNIMTQVTVLIKEKINFFRDFLGNELTSAVGDKMNSFFGGETSELRQVLYMFNKLLQQRHKFSSRKNLKRSMKPKAIRILIDIVDKAFVKDDDEILLMYVGITKNGLRDWTNMREHDISGILSNFIRYVTNNLQFNWTADTKKEVRTLVEVLMKSKVNSEDVSKYLFSKGSPYVKDQKKNYLFSDLD